MKHPDNDNDTFQTLGLAALRVVMRLEEKRPETEREKTPDEEVEQKRDHERFVERRLIEIERFERRYRSK